MAVTIAAAAVRCGTKPENDELPGLLLAATELVADVTDKAFRPIPAGILDEVLLRVVRNLWDGRKTLSGGQLATVNGQPAPPTARDPLASSAGLLGRYVAGMA